VADVTEAVDPHDLGWPVGYAPLLQDTTRRGTRRAVLVPVIAVVVGLVVLVSVIIVGSRSSSTPPAGAALPVPSVVGPYQQRTDALLDRIRNSFQDEAASSGGELQRFLLHGQVAAYTRDQTNSVQPTLILIFGRASAYPDIANAGITGFLVATDVTVDPADLGTLTDQARDTIDG
jgi:hypothetical protein